MPFCNAWSIHRSVLSYLTNNVLLKMIRYMGWAKNLWYVIKQPMSKKTPNKHWKIWRLSLKTTLKLWHNTVKLKKSSTGVCICVTIFFFLTENLESITSWIWICGPWSIDTSMNHFTFSKTCECWGKNVRSYFTFIMSVSLVATTTRYNHLRKYTTKLESVTEKPDEKSVA